MPRTLEENIAHLLRRAGFGSTPEELAAYVALGYAGAVDRLVNFEQIPDTVDSRIGQPGYAVVLPATALPTFAPNYILNHARARWLFRMLYSPRPLQEKMALFWHNHFATGYTSIAQDTSGPEAVRLMAAVPEEDFAGQIGQIEMFRRMALANFYDLLVAVSRDPAMLYWLDGRLNFKSAPQENYGREVMELFTIGVFDAAGRPNYTEDDVKAAARVFTGWNLLAGQVGTLTITYAAPTGPVTTPLNQYQFYYNARGHDTDPKTFTFPIYPDGSRTIPARPATIGAQDGLDFLAALLRHPSTAHRLATRLYQFFVNDIAPPGSAVNTIAGWLTSSNFDMRAVLRQIFLSEFFLADENFHARYRWPVEHLVGVMKTLGPGNAALNSHVFVGTSVLDQMDEKLFDPPTVEGYKAGATWINATTMLARANFVLSPLSGRQNEFADLMTARGAALTANPAAIVDFWLSRFGITQPEAAFREELISYLRSSVNWTGSLAQLRTRIPPLIHLIGSSGEYAFA